MSSLEISDHLQRQLTNARREIHNLRKQLNSLQHIHRKDIDEIVKRLDNWQCSDCKKKEDKSESFSSISAQSNIEFKPIGIINSEFPRIRGTPRQPTITMYNTKATLVLSKDVFTNPSHALQDLEQFSHMWIIFAFHQNSRHAKAKVAPPRLNGVRTGVFATRSPHRPCPIGLSLVKIEKIVDDIIYFTGVDMIDQTPVLDIKPYIPHYDQPSQLDSTVEINYLETYNMPEFQQTGESAQEILGTRVELLAQGTFAIGEVVDSEENILSEPVKTLSVLNDDEKPRDDSKQKRPSSDEVRVPSWIDRPPVHKLIVTFNKDALTQLHELGPELADERSRIITSVLREDPRSVYLREKWDCSFYIWRIGNICVTCKFNNVCHAVEITKICLDGC